MYSTETFSRSPSRFRTALLRDMSMSRVPSRGGSFAPAPRRGIFFVYCVVIGWCRRRGDECTGDAFALVASGACRRCVHRIVFPHRGTRQQPKTRGFHAGGPAGSGRLHQLLWAFYPWWPVCGCCRGALFALGDSLPFFPKVPTPILQVMMMQPGILH